MRISRFVVLAALAATVLLSLLIVTPRDARATEICWLRVPVQWDTTGAPYIKTIGDESDTMRTKKINLGSVAWEAFDTQNGVGGGARVEIEVTGTNTATDTLNYQVEKCVGSVCNYAASYLAETASVYNTATSDGDGTGKYFTGYLQIDRDAAGVGNIWLCKEIRLKFQGDQSGSSAKVGQCKLWITLPFRCAR